MALHLARYRDSMRIGQGFNSYTQQICIEDAVKIDHRCSNECVFPTQNIREWFVSDTESNAESLPDRAVLTPSSDDSRLPTYYKNSVGESEKPECIAELSNDLNASKFGDRSDAIPKIIYTTRYVHELSEIAVDMGVTGAAVIKSSSFGSNTGNIFLDMDKFRTADFNIYVSFKVIHQSSERRNMFVFHGPLTIEEENFTDVFGDSFISGFLEGGEFNALIGICILNKEKMDSVAAAVMTALTPKAAASKDDTNVSAAKQTIAENAKITIKMVRSHGYHVHCSGAPWTIDSVIDLMARFPDLVATDPKKIYAVLTKYDTLRCFRTSKPLRAITTAYDIAIDYANSLLDAYADYKSIYRELSTDMHLVRTDFGKFIPRDSAAAGADVADATTFSMADDKRVFASSILGAELARQGCRSQMMRIMKEIDVIKKHPTLAANETRFRVFQNPVVFQSRIPKVDVVPKVALAPPPYKAEQPPIRTLPCGVWNSDVAHKHGTPVSHTSAIVPYKAEPRISTIVLGITSIDIRRNTNIRFAAYAESVTSKEFTISIDQWGGSIVSSGKIAWLGIPSDNANFQTGRIETHDRGSRHIKFSRPFATPPSVLVWIIGLDHLPGYSVCACVNITGITSESFSVFVDTCRDGTLNWCSISWIAFTEASGCVAGKYYCGKTKGASGICSFPKERFSKPPIVLHAFSTVDVDKHRDTRVRSKTMDVTTERFGWDISTWDDSIIRLAAVEWLAVPSP